MKYSGIENPSLYDNVRYYSMFNYTDEIQLEEELFTLEIIELNVIERFREELSNNYLILISTKIIEKGKIDLEELKKFIADECYEINIENIKMIFVD